MLVIGTPKMSDIYRNTSTIVFLEFSKIVFLWLKLKLQLLLLLSSVKQKKTCYEDNMPNVNIEN